MENRCFLRRISKILWTVRFKKHEMLEHEVYGSIETQIRWNVIKNCPRNDRFYVPEKWPFLCARDMTVSMCMNLHSLTMFTLHFLFFPLTLPSLPSSRPPKSSLTRCYTLPIVPPSLFFPPSSFYGFPCSPSMYQLGYQLFCLKIPAEFRQNFVNNTPTEFQINSRGIFLYVTYIFKNPCGIP